QSRGVDDPADGACHLLRGRVRGVGLERDHAERPGAESQRYDEGAAMAGVLCGGIRSRKPARPQCLSWWGPGPGEGAAASPRQIPGDPLGAVMSERDQLVSLGVDEDG